MAELAVYDNDPTLYLFTSLTAGSSHIVTATSRIETILRANKIPFKGVDTATDELARKLFQRRASGKKLPLLVKEGYVLGDLEMIEEWNEYDELHEALGVGATKPTTTIPAKPTPQEALAQLEKTQTHSSVASAKTTGSNAASMKENESRASSEQNLAIRQLGAEAARIAAAKKQQPGNLAKTNPLLAEKVNSPATGSIPASASASAVQSESPSPTTQAAPTAKAVSADTAKTDSPTAVLSPPSGPISRQDSQSSTGSGSGRRRSSFAGADIEEASPEEIRKIEQATAIAEVSSSEEEDSEEEREQERRRSSLSPAGEKMIKAKLVPRGTVGRKSSEEGDKTHIEEEDRAVPGVTEEKGAEQGEEGKGKESASKTQDSEDESKLKGALMELLEEEARTRKEGKGDKAKEGDDKE